MASHLARGGCPLSERGFAAVGLSQTVAEPAITRLLCPDKLPMPARAATPYLRRQLVINTGTTIVTFLMVFLIQNTQNRDTEALQLKIDELIRVTEQARNRLINLEDLTEEEMDKVKRELA